MSPRPRRLDKLDTRAFKAEREREMILSKSMRPLWSLILVNAGRPSPVPIATATSKLSTEHGKASKPAPNKILSHPNFKLGFIGTGKIAQAIISGLISKEQIKAHQIYASDSNASYLNFLRTKHPLFIVSEP